MPVPHFFALSAAARDESIGAPVDAVRVWKLMSIKAIPFGVRANPTLVQG
jgi:hypothetical protein